jgi:hypothetical protein
MIHALLAVVLLATSLNPCSVDTPKKLKAAVKNNLAVQAAYVAGRELPPTARQLSAFKGFTEETTVAELFQKVGAPDRDNGSGKRHIYIWELEDGSEVWAATADNKKMWYLDHVKNGMREKRFFGPSDTLSRPGKRVKS